MSNDYFREYLTTHAQAALFKKIFIQWLEVQSKTAGKDEYNPEISSILEAIKAAKLKDAIGFVEKIVTEKRDKKENLDVKADAIVCLGLIGEKEHLALIETFLKDKSEVSTFSMRRNNQNVTYTTLLCDVALGMMIHMNGESPKKYGFAGMSVFGYTGDAYDVDCFSFTDEESRKKTFKMWEDFVANKAKEAKAKDGQKEAKPMRWEKK
jgi:hypothetical protein